MDVTKVLRWLDEDVSVGDVNENSLQSDDEIHLPSSSCDVSEEATYHELQNVPTTSYNVSDELQIINSHNTTQFSNDIFSDYIPTSSESSSDQLSDSSQYDSNNSINAIATPIQSRSHVRGREGGLEEELFTNQQFTIL